MNLEVKDGTIKPFDTPAWRVTQGERGLTKLERKPFVLSALRSKVYRGMGRLKLLSRA
jgi:hypothetical protein